MRIEYEQPWVRMAIILGAVAVLTLLSALVFKAGSLRRFYGLEDKNR
jgi:hypothetical protein